MFVKTAFLSYTIMMRTHLTPLTTLGLATVLLLTAMPVIAQEDDIGDAPSVSIEDMLLQQALNGEPVQHELKVLTPLACEIEQPLPDGSNAVGRC